MPSVLTLLAPLALLLPLGVTETGVGQGDGVHEIQTPQTARQTPEGDAGPMSSASSAPAPWLSLADPLAGQTAQQVRIERRVIMRINPRPMPTRRNLMAELPPGPPVTRVVERRVGKCLKLDAIAATRPERGGRLMLFMRDRRIIAADLERACSARDFYSGFYLEPNEDGQLCIDRDRLQSRSGSKCQVSRLREIVFEQG